MGCLFNEKHLDMVSIFVRYALCAFRILHFSCQLCPLFPKVPLEVCLCIFLVIS